MALLRTLFESRIMTTGHIATIHFDGKKEAAKKRLQKLKAAQLIGERTQRVNEPSVLFLTRQAFALLESEGVLKDYPPIAKSSLEKRARVSELTLRHELEVMDVKAAFHSAIRKTESFSAAEFSTWPLLNQFQACRDGYGGAEVLVKPDGFIRIHEKEADGGLSEHTFFLEVDRSSETQDMLVARAGCYFDYFKSGGFAVRNGAPRSAFREYWFRVLMVFKTAERRNNTAERLLQNIPPILSHACLSTFEEVTTNPLGPIWIQPFDYRKATKETPFDSELRRDTWAYKRQSAREEFVERNVRKIRILVDETESATTTAETSL